MFGNFGCCLWWFILGLLLGFLLGYLLSRRGRTDAAGSVSATAQAPVAAAPAVIAPVASAVADDSAAHHDEVDALHAEIADLKAQLARELSAHSADAERLKAMGSSAAAAAYGFVPQLKTGEDDLAIVEGIGPKIAQVLRDAGIRTFVQLAATQPARLHEILEAAGPRFKIANRPETWPRQSDLCARGEWEALRKYQDELTDGVDRRKPGSQAG